MSSFYKFLKLDKIKFDDHRDTGYYISCMIMAFIFITFHLGFLIYYSIIKLIPMVIINLISLLIYCLSLFLNYKKQYDNASFLIIAEISIYCIISVYFVGWTVGTQWYLPVAVLPCYFAFNLKQYKRTLYISLLCLSMFICFMVDIFIPPIYTIGKKSFIRAANIAICMIGSILLVKVIEISNSLTEKFYQSQIESLTDEANTDTLTKMWNRRYAMAFLKDIMTKPAETKRVFVAIIDIDFFKNVNDSYGHEIGDKVLVYLAREIQESFRHNDVCARWGGEEFLIVLCQLTQKDAFAALEKFRHKIESNDFVHNGISIHITVSMGVSGIEDSSSYEQWVNKSDMALYYGKRNGRNKVVDYSTLKPEDLLNRNN